MAELIVALVTVVGIVDFVGAISACRWVVIVRMMTGSCETKSSMTTYSTVYYSHGNLCIYHFLMRFPSFCYSEAHRAFVNQFLFSLLTSRAALNCGLMSVFIGTPV